ncbi:hypothetical protein G9A89_017255 [Geosiphon pyriformis]|nr:hypothetical protein G9A89_017255 [Geosiphon pyriformis]
MQIKTDWLQYMPNDLFQLLIPFLLVASLGQRLQNQEADIVMSESLGVATSSGIVARVAVFDASVIGKMEDTLKNLAITIMGFSAKMDNAGLIMNKFDEMRILFSGVDKDFLGVGVAIILNNSLAYYVAKIKEVPGHLISIRFLFKGKLLVTILGLYTGASAKARFGQSSVINSFIARAVNSSTFVVLGGNFNENGSKKSTNFEFCSKLGLVNTFGGHSLVNALTWDNSRGAMKVIDYIFVSGCLSSAVAGHKVTSVSDFFDTDHNSVMVSIGLVLEGVVVKSADEIFSKHWFSNFQCLKNKQFSKFLGLELLVAKIVKKLGSADILGFNLLIKKWSTLDANKALVVTCIVQAGEKQMDILKHLFIIKSEYRKFKMYESKLAEEVQYAPLGYVRDDVFSGVMCVIDISELVLVIGNLPDGKTAGLSGILNKLWKHSSEKTSTQYALDMASEFFVINDISINSEKTVAIFINQDVITALLSICGQPILIAKKGKAHYYLGIFLSTERLFKPSVTKAHFNVCFFTNVLLRKTVTNKQFLYLVLAVL